MNSSKEDFFEEEIIELYCKLIDKILTLPDDLPESVACMIIGCDNVLDYAIIKKKLYEKVSNWDY